MNAAELAAIQARTTDGHWHPRQDHRADAAKLLAELDLQWRAAERAAAKIHQVREWATNTEDAFRRDRDDNEASDLACELVAEVRKIVGPR